MAKPDPNSWLSALRDQPPDLKAIRRAERKAERQAIRAANLERRWQLYKARHQRVSG